MPQDLVEAYKWLSLAASHGHKEATAFKAELEKKLSPEQKTRAQQLADAALGTAQPKQ